MSLPESSPPDPLWEGDRDDSPEPDYPVAEPEPGQGRPELRVASLLLDSKPPEEEPPPEPRFQFSLGELFLLTFLAALMLGGATSVAGGIVTRLETLAGLIGLGLLASGMVAGLFQFRSKAAIHLWWGMLVLYFVTCVAAIAAVALVGR
jgi:hypothetical protein